MTVKAMKSGAVEFLTKPFREQDLVDAIQEALKRADELRKQQAKIGQLQERYSDLPREGRRREGRAPRYQRANGLEGCP